MTAKQEKFRIQPLSVTYTSIPLDSRAWLKLALCILIVSSLTCAVISWGKGDWFVTSPGKQHLLNVMETGQWRPRDELAHVEFQAIQVDTQKAQLLIYGPSAAREALPSGKDIEKYLKEKYNATGSVKKMTSTAQTLLEAFNLLLSSNIQANQIVFISVNENLLFKNPLRDEFLQGATLQNPINNLRSYLEHDEWFHTVLDKFYTFQNSFLRFRMFLYRISSFKLKNIAANFYGGDPPEHFFLYEQLEKTWEPERKEKYRQSSLEKYQQRMKNFGVKYMDSNVLILSKMFEHIQDRKARLVFVKLPALSGDNAVVTKDVSEIFERKMNYLQDKYSAHFVNVNNNSGLLTTDFVDASHVYSSGREKWFKILFSEQQLDSFFRE